MSQSELYAKLHKIAKGYRILYVEDDEGIASVMGSVLSLFSQSLHKASNGQEGLELYESLKPDLIITDISMPVMNGIAMIKAIREKDHEIPIMINSAYSDQSYLLESIYLGVDRYTTKPIKHEEFLEGLYFMLTKLKQRDEAKLYEKIKLQERINQASTRMIQEMMEVYPHPTLVYTADGRLYGMNQAAITLFNVTQGNDENKSVVVERSFVPGEGYICDLLEVEEEKPSRIQIKGLKGRKIYTVSKKAIESQEFGRLFVYAFSDITRLEYEKQKSQNLFLYFREMARFRTPRYTVSQSVPAVEPIISPQTSVPPTPVVAPKLEAVQSYEQIRLQAMHYNEKTTALVYLQEMQDSVVEELAEMDELEAEMQESLVLFNEEPSIMPLMEIGRRLDGYARTLSQLIEFEDLAFSLQKLAQELSTIASLPKNPRKMHLLLDGIVADLKQWRTMIFVSQEATDIHYLDASLLSSCLQIETEFFGKESAIEEELDSFLIHLLL